MTLPTKLTVLRILLTVFVFALLLTPGWVAKLAALGGFAIASLTDWLDGFLARRWRQTSALGTLLDPIADKILVLGTFLAFVQLGLVPAWMVLVIFFRESLITGVRLFAASRNIVLAAAKEGKHKTVSQMVTLFALLIALLIQEWPGSVSWPSQVHAAIPTVILGCLWVTVILTVQSGAMFFWRHRAVLKDAVH